ncbi:hypothetical protein TOPH_00056, partial [Tolypocladium ophioglossoides CBS 100239]
MPHSSYSAASRVCSTSVRTEEAPSPCNTGSIHIKQLGRWRFGTYGEDLICSIHVTTATCRAGCARPYSGIVVSTVDGWMRRTAVCRTWTVSFVQQRTKYQRLWTHGTILSGAFSLGKLLPCTD